MPFDHANRRVVKRLTVRYFQSGPQCIGSGAEDPLTWLRCRNIMRLNEGWHSAHKVLKSIKSDAPK
jgi:hypothetical protein